MFTVTNIIMYGTPIFLAGGIWFWYPRKRGEVRPSIQFLMIGGPLMMMTLYGLWRQLGTGDAVQVWLALAGIIIGGGIVSFWFRERLYFKNRMIYRFIWGRIFGMIAYRDIAKVELGGEALRAVMKDGTFWKIPRMGTPDQAQDVVDRLRRANVELPDAVTLKNRFGIE